MPENNTFYRHIHVFRAVTILLIVSAHAWIMPIITYNMSYGKAPELKVIDSLAQTFFHDATLLFTLISGILFSLILKNRSWASFYKNKFLYVLLPYAVVTFLYTFIHWKLTWMGFYAVKPDSILGFLKAGFSNVPLGLAGFHLWYIPVLLVLFMLTPLLFSLVQRAPKLLLVLLVLAPLLVSREWPQFSWKTVIYFMGAYLVGLHIGLYYDQTLAFVARHQKIVWGMFLIFTGISIYLYQTDLLNVGFVALNESVLYPQKIALGLGLLYLIYRYEHHFPSWLDTIGHYSFAIYFFHNGILMILIKYLKAWGMLSNNPWYVLVLGLALFILCTVLSIAITKAVKLTTGKYSRMLIGS